MSDKIRGALFNMLGDLGDMTVLDAFAGSGALSFEAISRGASHALMVEFDKDAFRTIKGSIDTLGLEEQTTLIRGNINGWSNNSTDISFDVVLCDPPYDAVLEQLIHKLARHVAAEGLLVVSWPTKEPQPVIPGMELLRHKKYGNATLYVYQRH